jgi:acyl-CoA thioesterase-2
MSLSSLVQLTELEHDRFEVLPPGEQPLFGGCSIALGVAAAIRSAPASMVPKSLHACFPRAGRWGAKTELSVERVATGRSTAQREVRVTQGDRPVATLTVVFHEPGVGPDWQAESARAAVPAEECVETPSALPDPYFELRTVNQPPASVLSGASHPFWARPLSQRGEEPVDPSVAMAFISDYLVVFSMHLSGIELGEAPTIRTLTHDLWFHRAVDSVDWLLYSAEPTTMSSGRGLARGAVSDRDGRLVASFVQEVVLQD